MGPAGRAPAARRAVQETDLQQVGFVNFLDRSGVFADRGRQRGEADGATPANPTRHQ